ncbi:MG2 domain-containing protein [Cognatitamlana onchidii]|uniref:MG2 domain-containing protein n=1 Tax=Cognatitamlana onchidii TaxID=2562860 RepID=UPI0010A619FE|nr:MG2 domain-containing protein [Algibacter onchidii]
MPFNRFLVLLIFFVNVSAQEANRFQDMLKYLSSATTEQVYIQTDKDLYTPGESIWIKAYLVDAKTHAPSNMSRVIYIEILNSKDSIIAQQKLYAPFAKASSNITLPKQVSYGTYTLRGYTKYMLNNMAPVIFQKELSVLPKDSMSNIISENFEQDTSVLNKTNLNDKAPKVQFFPEGGDLVIGMECVLGAIVKDSEGNGLALEGKIVDDNGHLVTFFNSYKFGLGWTSILVKPNTQYYLQIPYNNTLFKYPLPDAILKGYTFRVTNFGKHVNINVSTNISNGLQGARLVGHIRGRIILNQVLKSHEMSLNTIKLITDKLPEGIAQFTLFKPNSEPICERSTFIENASKNLELQINTDRTHYGLREKVNVELQLLNDDGEHLEGNFSAAVVPKSEIKSNTNNIKNWLWLNSHFGGSVLTSNYFFKEKFNGHNYMLDLLILTQGGMKSWSSFMAKDTLSKDYAAPELGIMIEGITTAYKNQDQPRQTLTTLNVLSNELIQEKMTTNEQGKFSFGPFVFEDSLSTVIIANKPSGASITKDDISIFLEPYFPKVEPLRRGKRHSKQVVNPILKANNVDMIELEPISNIKHDSATVHLEEVILTHNKKKTSLQLLNKELNARTLHGTPSKRLIPDSIPGLERGPSNVFNLLRYVPGVRVSGSFPNQEVFIRPKFGRFGDPPFYLLDGTPVSKEYIKNMPISDILFVDVLKGADASIYGGRASGGVVAVYTKRGDDVNETATAREFSGMKYVMIPGFHKTSSFYKPSYEDSLTNYGKPDYRKTLHWEPNIELSSDSSHSFYFFTGDLVNNYVIRIEGITKQGVPVFEEFNFYVTDSGKLLGH